MATRVQSSATAFSPPIATPLAVGLAVEPFENGKVLYQRIAPTAAGEPARAMLYFMATVTNNTGTTLRLTGIEVAFPGSGLGFVLFPRDEDLPPGAHDLWLTGDEAIQLTQIPATVRVRLVFDDGRDAWRVWPLAAHATSYPFFAKPEPDADYGECLVLPGKHAGEGGGSQHFGYDVGVLGPNHVTGKLSKYKTDGGSNADAFLWGRPFYAMADGVVLRAVDKHPDNPSPSQRSFARKDGAYETPYQVTDVAVASLAVANRTMSRLAAAVVTDGGIMRLLMLAQTQDGDALTLLADAAGPAAEQVSVARVSETHVVTASRARTAVTLTLWRMPFGTTALSALDTRTLPATAADVKVVRLSGERVLTAARTPAGTLALAVWGVADDALSPAPLGTAAAGAVAEAEAVALDGGARVVTAVRQADGQLKLIVWDVTPGPGAGVTLARRGDALGGAVTEVALSTTSRPAQVCTAVRRTTGAVHLVTWDVDDAGVPVARGADTADPGTVLQLAFFKTSSVAAAFRAPDGDLGIAAWNVGQDGPAQAVTHRRLYAQGAGPVDRLAVTRVPTDQPTLVTAVRTHEGRLKLILWQYTDSNLIYVLYGNEMVCHVHLRQGSIPDALLADAPVPVKRGDLIGRMGHSGKSSGPHLHIHAVRVRPELLGDLAALRAKVQAGEAVGAFRPLHFHGVQGMRYSSAVQPGGAQANSAATFDKHGAYFDSYVVWP